MVRVRSGEPGTHKKKNARNSCTCPVQNVWIPAVAKMHQPGIEPGSYAWEAYSLPLAHWCHFAARSRRCNFFSYRDMFLARSTVAENARRRVPRIYVSKIFFANASIPSSKHSMLENLFHHLTWWSPLPAHFPSPPGGRDVRDVRITLGSCGDRAGRRAPRRRPRRRDAQSRAGGGRPSCRPPRVEIPVRDGAFGSFGMRPSLAGRVALARRGARPSRTMHVLDDVCAQRR